MAVPVTFQYWMIPASPFQGWCSSSNQWWKVCFDTLFWYFVDTLILWYFDTLLILWYFVDFWNLILELCFNTLLNFEIWFLSFLLDTCSNILLIFEIWFLILIHVCDSLGIEFLQDSSEAGPGYCPWIYKLMLGNPTFTYNLSN